MPKIRTPKSHKGSFDAFSSGQQAADDIILADTPFAEPYAFEDEILCTQTKAEDSNSTGISSDNASNDKQAF